MSAGVRLGTLGPPGRRCPAIGGHEAKWHDGPSKGQQLIAPRAAAALAAAAAAAAVEGASPPAEIDFNMFAGVAPGVPRSHPTRSRLLPEEQAAETCAYFYQRSAAMHNLTLAQPEGSPLRR